MSNIRYWAAAPTDEIAAEIEGQFTNYHGWLDRSGYKKRIRVAYDRFYGLDTKGSLEIEQSEDGSISHLSIPHYNNLLKRLHILVTQNKTTFVPRSRNSDAKSQVECDLGRGLLDYYADEKAMSANFSEAVLMALVAQEGFVHSPWDEMAGDELAGDVTTNKVYRTGDQSFEILSPLDVARSTTQKKSGWHILRLKRNKHDLAALFPEKKEQILSTSSNDSYDFISFKEAYQYEDEDMVDVFVLYHGKTPALRRGREVWICGSEVLKDRSLAYRKPPVARISGGDVLGQVYGESPGISLLPAQEAIDALFSAVTTNNVNSAVQNFWSGDPNMKVEQLSEGMNMIHSTQPPTSLQLTNSSPETYKLIDSLINQQQLLSGINDATRGAGASSATGVSLALQLATAVQFATALQASYAQMASDVATCVINNLQSFASHEMIAVIGGTSKKSYVKSFKAQDILNIDRVSVDLGDAITQSLTGRYELMQQMMQYGALKNPDQIIEFLRTGQIESATEDKFKDSLTIREENEMLKRGETPVAVITDIHPQHIAEHRTVFSDPEMRNDPDLLANTIAHLQQHGVLWNDIFRLYPDIAAALNMPPPPGMAMGQPQPGPQETQEGAPPGPPPPEAEQGGLDIPSLPPGAPEGLQQSFQQIEQAVANQPNPLKG